MSVNRVGNPGANAVQGSEAQKSSRAGKANAAADKAKAEGNSSAAAASGDSQTTISSKGRDAAKAMAAANSAPDVREEKIAELKRRIAAGKYQVDPKAVADKMVDEHLSSGIG
jgi:negative regulator of flagellin synthesis FlgM